MKICFVNTNKNWGGGEKWHCEMALQMNVRDHDVYFIAHPNGKLINRLKDNDIKIIKFRIGNLSFLNQSKIKHIKKVLRRMDPDVIILNMPSDLKSIGIAAFKAGIKNIIYRRGSAIPIRNSKFNRYLFKNVVSGILTNSEETKNTILQNNPDLFDPHKIRVIYNGINIEEFNKQPSQTLIKRNNEQIILGNAARLSRQKGHEILFDIAKILKEKNIDFHLYLAGTGEKESHLKKLVEKLGLNNNITFLGFVKNIKSFMEGIDVFLLTSEWEGFGYVLAEAMACKKPSIAFNISSNPELISDGENGFLVEPFDKNQFAEKIELLANDDKLRDDLGQNAEKILMNKFTLDKSVREFSRFISELKAK